MLLLKGGQGVENEDIQYHMGTSCVIFVEEKPEDNMKYKEPCNPITSHALLNFLVALGSKEDDGAKDF